jgi:enamine deaminase RidA (YjgF/YER057c/UK114 family)
MADAFNPPGVVEPFGIFSQGALQGDGETLNVAGQVAWDEAGEVVGKGDIVAQTRQVLENTRTIVSSVGGTMDDIVSVIVYVIELDGLTEIHKVRSEFFSKPYPASTLVQVVGLVHPDLLIEMSAVAVIPRHRFRRPA